MLLLVHIVIALGGVLQATYALVRPSRSKVQTSYALMAATLASGTLLVWQLHVPLMQPCLSGLLYIGIVGSLLLGAKHRLRLAGQAVNTSGWSKYLDK